MKKPILLLVFLLCTLLVSHPAPASPLSDYWDQKEVRAALDALPDLEKMERTLHFEVRDAVTGEILPEVSYLVHNWEDKDKEPIKAAGQYDHVLPVGFPQNFHYSISAPGHAKQMRQLELDNNYNADIPLKIQLGRACIVSGRVISEDGAPIEGAKVQIHGNNSAYKPPGHMYYYDDTLSDADGYWSVDNFPLDNARVRFEISHPEYITKDYSYKWVSPSEVAELVMKPGIPFKGRVLDANGTPVSGVNLTINRNPEYQVESDEEGNFAFRNSGNRENVCVLKAVAPGFANFYTALNPNMPQEGFKVVMQPGRPLHLRFLAQNNVPLANKKLYAKIDRINNQVDFFNLETDDKGELTVQDAPVGVKWGFGANSSGVARHQYRSLDDLSLEPGEVVHTLQLESTAFIALLVVDAKTDKALESFNVLRGDLYEKARPQQHVVSWWQPDTWLDYVATAVEGPEVEVSWYYDSLTSCSKIFKSFYYHYDNKPIQFRVEAPGYFPSETDRITADDGEVLLKIRMTPGESLRVRAVDAAGVPCADTTAAWVPKDQQLVIQGGSAMAAQTPADAEGMIQLPVIHLENYCLLLNSAKGVALLNGADLRNGQSITLKPWGRLEGTVSPEIAFMAKKGMDVQCTLTLQGIKIWVFTITPVNKDLHFITERLLPGEYSIGPMADYWAGAIPWAKTTVHAGETATVGVSGGRAVKGQLEMPDEAWQWFRKEPIKVYFVRTDIKPNPYSTYMTSKEDGSFGIEALPPGEYKLEGGYILNPDIPTQGQGIRYFVQSFPFRVNEDGDKTPLDLGVVQIEDRHRP